MVWLHCISDFWTTCRGCWRLVCMDMQRELQCSVKTRTLASSDQLASDRRKVISSVRSVGGSGGSWRGSGGDYEQPRYKHSMVRLNRCFQNRPKPDPPGTR